MSSSRAVALLEAPAGVGLGPLGNGFLVISDACPNGGWDGMGFTSKKHARTSRMTDLSERNPIRISLYYFYFLGLTINIAKENTELDLVGL